MRLGKFVQNRPDKVRRHFRRDYSWQSTTSPRLPTLICLCWTTTATAFSTTSFLSDGGVTNNVKRRRSELSDRCKLLRHVGSIESCKALGGKFRTTSFARGKYPFRDFATRPLSPSHCPFKVTLNLPFSSPFRVGDTAVGTRRCLEENSQLCSE